ncbi:MAG: hypothetical protein RRC34_08245 [Lentisphaeria bacterium]|nr:hypothetical protein [Lentisphaeria bacterium]
MAQVFFRTLQITLVSVVWAASFSHGEEPSFSVGFLKWGQTPKVCAYQWAQAPIAYVSNPTDKEVDLIIAVRAVDGAGAQYSKKIRLGPGAMMEDVLDMVADPQTEYLATLSHADGRLIQKQEIISHYQNPFMTVGVFFGSDDPDLTGVSTLSRDKTLGRRMLVTRSRAEDLPQRLPGFGSASVLVLIGTDFDRMCAPQFAAIEAFVASGGTLVVARPETITRLEKTPLREVLPVVPLGSRRIEAFPELGAWGPAGETAPGPTWETGIEFLEMMPEKEALVTLRHGRYPAFVWGAHGLGRVAVAGFDIFSEGIRGGEHSRRIWRHILSVAGDQPFATMAMYDNSLSQATSRLIGFKARSAEHVLAIMVAYCTVVLSLFLLGAALKKHVTAWVGGIVCSLTLTVLILAAADRQLDQQDPKNAIVVELACQTAAVNDTTALFAGEKRISVINRQADRPDIRGESSGVWLRPPAPEPAAMLQDVGDRNMLSLIKEGNRHTLTRLNVRENKPVTFFSRYDHQAGVGITPPSLGYDDGVPRLIGGRIPSDFPGESIKAYLLLGEGFQRVQIKKNSFVLTADDGGGMELDVIARDFETFLRTARLPVPSLALFYRTSLPSSELTFGDGGYTEQRYRLHLVPVKIPAGKGDVTVPGGAVRIAPVGKNSRALRWNGIWRDGFLYDNQTSYVFSAQVPVEFRRMVLTGAEVTVSIQSAVTGVRGAAELIPLGKAAAVSESVSGVSPTKINGDRSLFNGLDEHEFINPVDGTILVKLTVARDVGKPPVAAAAGADKWRVGEFSISLKGTRD